MKAFYFVFLALSTVLAVWLSFSGVGLAQVPREEEITGSVRAGSTPMSTQSRFYGGGFRGGGPGRGGK